VKHSAFKTGKELSIPNQQGTLSQQAPCDKKKMFFPFKFVTGHYKYITAIERK